MRDEMGAPKQKWTAEEEGALRAGVLKHGIGKWRTILKDPEFSAVLYLRSNVDLKDKWRNMTVMNTGYISGGKSRVSLKRVPMQLTFVKQEEATTSVSDVPQSDEETVDIKPICTSGSPLQIAAALKRSIVRLDDLILEAITNLNEPGGSSKISIAAYIEDQYWAPQDFQRVLSAKLKFLMSAGKLLKVKRKYIIAQFPMLSDMKRDMPIAHEGMQMNFPIIESDDLNMLKAQIDVELAKMRSMTPEEASIAAARAVAEAEAAIAQAEVAAREADEAEADAEAALAYADGARKMLMGRSISQMMIQA